VVPAVVRLSHGVGQRVERQVHGAAHALRVGERALLLVRDGLRGGVEHDVEVKGQHLAQDPREHGDVDSPRRTPGVYEPSQVDTTQQG